MGMISTVAWAAVFLAAVTLAIVSFVPLYFRHRTRHLIQVTHHLTEMARANRVLVRDPDVPDHVATFVATLTRYCTHPSLGRFVVRKVLNGDFFDAAQRAAEDKSPLALEIEQLSPSRRRQFTRLISHAMLSSASSDPVLAAFTRRLMLFGLMKDTAHELEGKGRDQALAVEATFAMPADGSVFRSMKELEVKMARDNRRLPPLIEMPEAA